MKKVLLSLSSVFLLSAAFAQDGTLIDPSNSQVRNPSAALEVYSTSQGFLAPRVSLTLTTTSAPITSPALGLLVFNTNVVNDVTAGFYFWNGSSWQRISTGNATFPTGTGTQNYVTKWNNPAGSTLGNSQIFDNGTNVGIGTTSPSEKLHINGGSLRLSYAAGETPYQVTGYASGTSLWEISGSATTAKTVIATSHDWDKQISIAYTPGTAGAAAGYLQIGQLDKNNTNWTHGITQFYTNGAERMRIKSDGNVGIGTTGPEARLHVEAGRIYGSKTTFPNPGSYTNADLVLGSNSDTREGYTGTNGSHIFLRSSAKSSITALDESNNLGQISYENLVWTIGENIGWGAQGVRLPALGAGYVKSDASGNLSSSAVAPGDLPNLAGDVSGAYNANVVADDSHNHTELESKTQYTWNASTAPRDFPQAIATSFVSSTEGWPSYGSVMHVGTYPNDGGALQLYAPYSSIYGGNSLRYRLGLYNNAGWTGWKTIWDDTNDGPASGMDADLLDGRHLAEIGFMQSDRDFPNGTLIQTNIDYSVTNGEPWLLEIEGNSYGNLIPVDIKVQGYIYSNTVINYGGISNGTNITGLVLFNYNGKLCFWFPTQGYWNGYNVFVNDSYAGVKHNRLVSITHEAIPASRTKEVALSSSIRQSWHSGNFTPSGGADNLGNHTATTTLNMNGNAIDAFTTLLPYGSGFNSGVADQSYGIYQEDGAWTGPYPDLVIAFHTGIKIGGHSSYNGTRFYNDAPERAGALEIMSVGNGDNNVRILYDLRVPIIYDLNNTGYYLDPASTSITNDMRANIFYDQGNTGYYIDPASTSITNDMRANIFYDQGNTGYYVDPNSTSNLSTIISNANIYNTGWYRGGSGDDGHVRLYGNSRQMVFRTDGSSGYSDNGDYPFVWLYGGDNSGNRRMILHNDGRIWTSAYGWLDTYFSTVGADNLGNHTATTTLNMNNQRMTNTRSFEINSGDLSGMGNNAYAIFREDGTWTPPYPDLRIAYHTGIKLGANATYEGIRFYTDYDMSGLVMAVNDASTGGAGNVYMTGNVGIGTTSPTSRLQLGGGLAVGTAGGISATHGSHRSIQINTDNYYTGSVNDNHSGALIYTTMPGGWASGRLNMGIAYNWGEYYTNPPTASIRETGIVGWNFLTWSDRRIKTNLETISYGLQDVMKMEPLSYTQHRPEITEGEIKLGAGTHTIGLIAQDLYEIIPEAVEKPEDESTDLWTVSYSKLTPVLIKAIQEQQKEIVELKKMVLELQKK